MASGEDRTGQEPEAGKAPQRAAKLDIRVDFASGIVRVVQTRGLELPTTVDINFAAWLDVAGELLKGMFSTRRASSSSIIAPNGPRRL